MPVRVAVARATANPRTCAGLEGFAEEELDRKQRRLIGARDRGRRAPKNADCTSAMAADTRQPILGRQWVLAHMGARFDSNYSARLAK